MNRWLPRFFRWHLRLWIRGTRTKEREFAVSIAMTCFVFGVSYLGGRVGDRIGFVVGAGVAFLMLAPLIFVGTRHIWRQQRRRDEREPK